MLDRLSANDFTKYLNDTFYLSSDSEEPIEAELIEVTEIETNEVSTGSNNKRNSFSIVFSGPPQPVLPQGIHALQHTEMGPLSLFIVPIGSDKKGMRYEAVFN
jgi:hypothetical protein